MHITVTIRMEASSRAELSSTFGEQIRVCRKHFDRLKKEQVFGPPENVSIRYLVTGAAWHAAQAEAAQVAQRGTPEMEDAE